MKPANRLSEILEAIEHAEDRKVTRDGIEFRRDDDSLFARLQTNDTSHYSTHYEFRLAQDGIDNLIPDQFKTWAPMSPTLVQIVHAQAAATKLARFFGVDMGTSDPDNGEESELDFYKRKADEADGARAEQEKEAERQKKRADDAERKAESMMEDRTQLGGQIIAYEKMLLRRTITID